MATIEFKAQSLGTQTKPGEHMVLKLSVDQYDMKPTDLQTLETIAEGTRLIITVEKEQRNFDFDANARQRFSEEHEEEEEVFGSTTLGDKVFALGDTVGRAVYDDQGTPTGVEYGEIIRISEPDESIIVLTDEGTHSVIDFKTAESFLVVLPPKADNQRPYISVCTGEKMFFIGDLVARESDEAHENGTITAIRSESRVLEIEDGQGIATIGFDEAEADLVIIKHATEGVDPASSDEESPDTTGTQSQSTASEPQARGIYIRRTMGHGKKKKEPGPWHDINPATGQPVCAIEIPENQRQETEEIGPLDTHCPVCEKINPDGPQAARQEADAPFKATGTPN